MAGFVRKLRPTGRKVVLLVREDIDRGVPLQAALSRALDQVPLSAEGRRQATDLAYWSLRAETRCLFVLHRLFPRFERFSVPVRQLLVAAAASLLFQEGAPAYAVLNETVEDVRLLAGRGVAGAVNAGLRALLRLEGAPLEEDFYREPGDTDELSAFFRRVSVSEALGRLFVHECGEERARAILEKSLARPVACVRVNAARSGWQEVRADLLANGGRELPGRAGRTGVCFPLGTALSLSGLAAEGKLSLQSAGSQLALAALDLPPDEPVWDACAGFGGKTTALLEAGRNVVLASDLSWRRLSSLAGECARLGLSAPGIVLADGRQPPLSAWSGNIVLDVPCSGLGVLARRPDIKLRAPGLRAHARVQKALLETMLALVPRGRRVAYITCTVTGRENGQLVRAAATGLAELESEWATPLDLPFEDMYAALLRRT